MSISGKAEPAPGPWTCPESQIGPRAAGPGATDSQAPETETPGSETPGSETPGSKAADSQTAAPEAGRPIRCNCQALRQATRRVTQMYDHALAPAGIRVTQYAILHWLGEHGPSTMKALADVMVMDRATLGHNLRPLESKSLVTRAVGTDRRIRLVSLTPLGVERLADARQGWRDAQAAFERAFGPDEALALRVTLARIAALPPG